MADPQTTWQLPLYAASDAGLADFGRLIGASDQEPGSNSRFYDGFIHISRPVDFVCDQTVELQLATLRRRPARVRYLERHFKHTQTFIPLAGRPFVMVLAPPSDTDIPDLSAAKAFHFDGTAGFSLHIGTWHEFPFVLDEGVRMVVVLSSQTGYDLAAKDPLTLEAYGPDLDKKDIVARTGVTLAVDLDAEPILTQTS